MGNGMPDIMLFSDSNVNLLIKNDRNTKYYTDFLKRCKLTQLLSTPTRITTRSRTLIDHIVVNRPELFSTFGTVDSGLSDHCMIFTSRKSLKCKPPVSKIWTRSYRQYDPHLFHIALSKIDWTPVYQCNCVDDAAQIFTTMFTETIDLFAPYKWITCRGKSADWMTNDFLSIVDTKHFRCRKFNQNPTPENQELKRVAIWEVTRTKHYLQ